MVYLVIFDKTGDSKLSGWHYEKLHEFDAEWIQRSVVRFEEADVATEFSKKLKDFGVDEVKVLLANEIMD